MASAVTSLDRLRRAGQFTALVDILFATIGIFVIVFALQDTEQPVTLLPAPYDAVLTCDADRTLLLHQPDADPAPITRRQIDGLLSDRLAQGGRFLIALSGACARDDGTGFVPVDSLRDLERTLGERPADATRPLVLFEFAPLGAGPEAVADLLDRFAVSVRGAP